LVIDAWHCRQVPAAAFAGATACGAGATARAGAACGRPDARTTAVMSAIETHAAKPSANELEEPALILIGDWSRRVLGAVFWTAHETNLLEKDLLNACAGASSWELSIARRRAAAFRTRIALPVDGSRSAFPLTRAPRAVAVETPRTLSNCLCTCDLVFYLLPDAGALVAVAAAGAATRFT